MQRAKEQFLKEQYLAMREASRKHDEMKREFA
jgi:hypothetical protein